MRSPRKILVFRSGLLGDTLVGVPALWALRTHFPPAHITYLWQSTGKKDHVLAPNVLGGSGLVNEFRGLPIRANVLARGFEYCRLFWYVFRSRFDIAVILEANHWPRARERFLRFAGIPLVVGPRGNGSLIYRDAGGRLPRVQNIVDELLDLVARIGIEVPNEGGGNMRLPGTMAEKLAIDRWLERRNVSPEAILIAVAPGSNMPTKRWPTERFAATVSAVLEGHDLIPVVFGGDAERELGSDLLKQWGRGVVAAGDLNIREGIELLRRCRLFLGNDTGTMHMAVAAGTPCVAVFSAIDMPGRWEPYGPGNVVFRIQVDCEGCLLRECIDEGMRCILSISETEVAEACKRLLSEAVAGAA